MSNSNDNELCIVTEIGTFGELNIKDPTKKKIKKENDELDALIEEAINTNNKNLNDT